MICNEKQNMGAPVVGTESGAMSCDSGVTGDPVIELLFLPTTSLRLQSSVRLSDLAFDDSLFIKDSRISDKVFL
jgi:hypothetical protein